MIIFQVNLVNPVKKYNEKTASTNGKNTPWRRPFLFTIEVRNSDRGGSQLPPLSEETLTVVGESLKFLLPLLDANKT